MTQPSESTTTTSRTPRTKNNAVLLVIAVVTFAFAVVKMPLEMEILARAGPRRTSINDFYSTHSRSAVDQRIDAKRSYSHMFNRNSNNNLRAVDDAAMAQKVDEIVHRYLNGDNGTITKRRHLRAGADKELFSERVQRVVEQFWGDQQQPQEPMEVVGAVPHQHKEEDPFDKEFSAEVQDIVNRYTEKDNSNNI